ncbi:MAG: hypothetical protein KatS3mg008_0220 [Acidimicrobiales bacterium]|nr:MAG: hypothetical protein KatS3mg008_0220 [Acidimicrobiales bacterium]
MRGIPTLNTSPQSHTKGQDDAADVQLHSPLGGLDTDVCDTDRSRLAKRRPLGIRLAALVAGFALVATACGGGGGRGERDQASGGNGGETGPAPCGEGTKPEPPPVPSPDEKDLKPKYGGQLVYGVEAETDGWNPLANRWAISGLLIASAVYDTLTKFDSNGVVRPFLAEEVRPNADRTVWRIKVRDGVKFHNGEDLTAEAVKMNLDAFRESPLTGQALDNIESVNVVDRLTVEVRMKRPWVPFGMYLASQVGVVMAPEMLRMPPAEAARNPIGTGPFKLVSWEPNRQWVGERNPDYWLKDPQGNRLPYLDRITFIPQPDQGQRQRGLETRDFDVIHTFEPTTIIDFRQAREAGELRAWESCYWGDDEEFLILVNNAKPPFNDKLAREAFARAVDREAIRKGVLKNVFPVASGPFSPSSKFFKEPPGGVEAYARSTYNPERAKELVREYEKKHGEPLRFTLGAPAGLPIALDSMQATQSFLQQAGMQVEIATVELAQYITNAIFGNYEAQVWRQYGSPDPDGEYVWWHGKNARPVGELSLNMARFDDPEINKALDDGRSRTSDAARRDAYWKIQDRFRSEFYLLWSFHAFWMVAANNNVHNVVFWHLPDGRQGLPLQAGLHPLAQIWVDS